MAKGIFLPSDNLDTSFMISYLQALLTVCPSIKCTEVKALDEEIKGFKIYFSEPKEDTVLKEGHITVDAQRVSIYPATTTLLIHGKSKGADGSLQLDLKESINHVLGNDTFLDIFDLGKKYDYEKWIVTIDKPEFKISQGEIYTLLNECLPERDLSVRAWCRICNVRDHFFQECGENTTSSILTENQKSLDLRMARSNRNESPSGKSNQKESLSKSSVRSPSVKADGLSGIDLESTDSYAEKLGREEVQKGIQDLGGNRKNGSKSKDIRTMFSASSKDIKIEVEDEEERNHSESNVQVPVLKKESPTTFQRDDSTSNLFHSDNSNDDDISIIDNETSPSHTTSHDSNFSRTDDAAFSEASMSPRGIHFKSDATFTLATPRSTQKRAKPTSRVEVTTVLSDRLQDCINYSCDTRQVLDRNRLDAFFTHVKKKSNPIRIALNFTKDANGLKMQLETILDRYYNTPQTGTKEDMQFIKWLNGLVERFDGTIPRKRKPVNKNQGGPPSKK